MKINNEYILPVDIETRSLAIIEEEIDKELWNTLNEEVKPIVKRVIHTTADFDYAKNLSFSDHVVEKALESLRDGAVIVTDTNMAKSGINKGALQKYGSEVYCFMADSDVALTAKERSVTRAYISMEKAATLNKKVIFAIGNAPTALIRLYELVKEGKIKPELIIAVPVGFVNVVEAKELIMELDIPFIVAKGRKGGSNVAASICNALLYMEGRDW
ncbi:MAG: precorrin-8X methylmutase [Anaerocolumna sp.]|nr:precorrin-8X methylmutase [Anaerocolumna sp.]